MLHLWLPESVVLPQGDAGILDRMQVDSYLRIIVGSFRVCQLSSHQSEG